MENEGENCASWQLISAIVSLGSCAWLLQFAAHRDDDNDSDDDVGYDEAHIAYTRYVYATGVCQSYARTFHCSIKAHNALKVSLKTFSAELFSFLLAANQFSLGLSGNLRAPDK